MAPFLRKRHLMFWLILAIILPILFILSIMTIPEPVYQEQLYQSAAPDYPQESSLEPSNNE